MTIDFITDFTRRFISDEAGQSVVEYSLLLTLISASSVIIMSVMGISISRLVSHSGATIQHIDSLSSRLDYQ